LGDTVAVAIGRGGAFRLQGAQMRIAIDHKLAGGQVVVADFLFDAGNPPARRNQQRSGVGIQPALQQGEQGGLARPVLADDAHTLARIDDKVCAVQQHFGAAAQGQAGRADHEANCSRVSSRIWSSVFSVLSQTGSKWGKAATKCWYSCPISSTSMPSGARKSGACCSRRRIKSMPSSPPASAMVGSCRYSCGRCSMEWLLT